MVWRRWGDRFFVSIHIPLKNSFLSDPPCHLAHEHGFQTEQLILSCKLTLIWLGWWNQAVHTYIPEIRQYKDRLHLHSVSSRLQIILIHYKHLDRSVYSTGEINRHRASYTRPPHCLHCLHVVYGRASGATALVLMSKRYSSNKGHTKTACRLACERSRHRSTSSPTIKPSSSPFVMSSDTVGD